MQHSRSIVILDFGGQYAHLIASRVRRLGVYSEIRPVETPAANLKHAAGIILSGGPQSVYDPQSPQGDPAIFELGVPVLGICYGLQWMTNVLGGEVKQGKVKEYGKTEIEVVNGGGQLFNEKRKEERGKRNVWMSHGDESAKLPEGFVQTATSDACTNSAFEDPDRKFYAVQFHPEVTHTEGGQQMLKNFIEQCDADSWSIESYSSQIEKEIIQDVGDRNVFMLVSGGVDSSVAFTLLNKALGADRVQGLLVDTGLMRKNEVSDLQKAFQELGISNLRIENASEEFFDNLKDIYEPEEKRRVIGETFLEVQKRISEEMGLTGDGWLLGQGTIYPDTIETGATKHADTIKTHHNRVEAVQKMIEQGLVIEPLKDLYKDEVRRLGEEIGLPHDFVWRHPFPGPGLGVRILCIQPDAHNPSPTADLEHELWAEDQAVVLPIQSVGVQGDGRTYRHAVAFFSDQPTEISEEFWQLATDIPNRSKEINRVLACTSQSNVPELTLSPGYLDRQRADLLREADAIAHEEQVAAGLYEDIWQFPVVLLPLGTSEGSQSIVLRPIASTDAMTANAYPLPSQALRRMTERIMALNGIDLVFFDLTNKPPATIEWE